MEDYWVEDYWVEKENKWRISGREIIKEDKRELVENYRGVSKKEKNLACYHISELKKMFIFVIISLIKYIGIYRYITKTNDKSKLINN